MNCVKQEVGIQFYKLSGPLIQRYSSYVWDTYGISMTSLIKVSLIKEVIERRIIKHHCVIHQQALRSKILKFGRVMSVVVTVVNHLCARALKHKKFRAFLKEMNAEYKYLVYHTKEVLQFLKNEPQKFEKLESKSWNHKFIFPL